MQGQNRAPEEVTGPHGHTKAAGVESPSGGWIWVWLTTGGQGQLWPRKIQVSKLLFTCLLSVLGRVQGGQPHHGKGPGCGQRPM